MKTRNLLAITCFSTVLTMSVPAFADIGTISFYGNNATRVTDLIQGCNISTDQILSLDYRVVTVSDSLWDNGAACGRKYLITCLSTPNSRSCTSGYTEVLVVGRCPEVDCTVSGQTVTMKIAYNRYSLLVRSRSATWAIIEYLQY